MEGCNAKFRVEVPEGQESEAMREKTLSCSDYPSCLAIHLLDLLRRVGGRYLGQDMSCDEGNTVYRSDKIR